MFIYLKRKPSWPWKGKTSSWRLGRKKTPNFITHWRYYAIQEENVAGKIKIIILSHEPLFHQQTCVLICVRLAAFKCSLFPIYITMISYLLIPLIIWANTVNISPQYILKYPPYEDIERYLFIILICSKF